MPYQNQVLGGGKIYGLTPWITRPDCSPSIHCALDSALNCGAWRRLKTQSVRCDKTQSLRYNKRPNKVRPAAPTRTAPSIRALITLDQRQICNIIYNNGYLQIPYNSNVSKRHPICSITAVLLCPYWTSPIRAVRRKF